MGLDGEVGRDSVGVLGVAGRDETWLVIANSLAVEQVGAYTLRTEELLPPPTLQAQTRHVRSETDRTLSARSDWTRTRVEPLALRERIRYTVARPVQGKR